MEPNKYAVYAFYFLLGTVITLMLVFPVVSVKQDQIDMMNRYIGEKRAEYWDMYYTLTDRIYAISEKTGDIQAKGLACVAERDDCLAADTIALFEWGKIIIPFEGYTISLTEEICDEYRWTDEIRLPLIDPAWLEDEKEWADNLTVLRVLDDMVLQTNIAAKCAYYDPTFREDFFWWTQEAYHFLDVLDQEIREDMYGTPQPGS